jgi:hypothetical protein
MTRVHSVVPNRRKPNKQLNIATTPHHQVWALIHGSAPEPTCKGEFTKLHTHHPGTPRAVQDVARVSAAIASGKRPDTFRTRKLRLTAPMVLQGGPCGRVGHRRTTITRKATPFRGGLPAFNRARSPTFCRDTAVRPGRCTKGRPRAAFLRSPADSLSWPAAQAIGTRRTITAFETGVFECSAALSSGTSTFASG